MIGQMHGFLSAVGAHPHLALVVVFMVALAESLAVVGTLVPAAVVMFGAGALIGSGAIGLWITLVAAMVGAILGDGLSYELGRSQEARIRAWPVLQHRANALARGEAFIRRWGGKSILLARFAGPVRAFVPLLAGFAHMPRDRFYTSNIFSALLWAPVHILPGVLFGASLQVAEAVSGRLAVIVLLLVLAIWFFAWLATAVIRFATPWFRHLRDRAVAHSRTRDTPMARATLALLDPASSGSQALLHGAVLLLVAGWLFLGVLEDVLSKDPLVQLDLAVFHFLQSLRTESMDRLMIVITEMGSVGVILPLVVVVVAWLAWRRSWRTAGYWIAVTAFAEVLVQLLKVTLGRHRPIDLYVGMERFSFPSGHAVLSTVILGFLAFLLSRCETLRIRLLIGAATAIAVTLIAFSRLYLGAHWLSDVVGGICLGLAWIALASMVYTQRKVDEDFWPRRLMLLVACALFAFGALWMNLHAEADRRRYVAVSRAQVLSYEQWKGKSWQQLPDRRLEAAGDTEEPFGLQWACGESGIADRLAALGWEHAPAWSLQGALEWFVPDAPWAKLPVLPRFDRGSRSRLVFVRWTTGQPEERQVLRLWHSELQVSRPNGVTLPVWYGAVYRETHARRMLLSNFDARHDMFSTATFAAQLPTDVNREQRSRDPGDLATVLASCP
ncbi:phosphatase PAP2 family protein [Polaromonas sp.]|uniref:bifunctional DedA family/phosphatase PAP2 family protein n=1 Tax=Polaromonas sp. TaxID=1869339 RepID=UPI00326463E2